MRTYTYRGVRFLKLCGGTFLFWKSSPPTNFKALDACGDMWEYHVEHNVCHCQRKS